jgi:hypothetical protein
MRNQANVDKPKDRSGTSDPEWRIHDPKSGFRPKKVITPAVKRS